MYLVCGEALFDCFSVDDASTQANKVQFQAIAGGSPFNVALGLRRMGIDVALLAGLSRDYLGQRLRRVLQDEGVNTRYLQEFDAPTTLAASADVSHQLTRVLRQALHAVLNRLRAGQVLLASVGATAPFVGLLGTVWGIFNALTGIADQGQVSIAQVSGPVGEALVMTAAGLAVAIPAVLAYNILGRQIARIEADLEGFARDLRALLAHRP